MKYLLKKSSEDEGVLCDKVVVDGFDCYVSDEKPQKGNWHLKNNIMLTKSHTIDDTCKKVIATTNSNIDIPKVVDEVKELFNSWYDKSGKITPSKIEKRSFIEGYNKSQETHPFSEEDVIGFAEWAVRRDWKDVSSVFEKSTKELIQLWKEQKPKVIYYHD